jgi:3-dehydroquinate dehydratase-2
MTDDKREGVSMGGEEGDAADPTPTVTLAELYEEQGLLDKAASVYKKLLVMEPDRTELKNALGAIEKRLAASAPQPEKSETKTMLGRLTGWQEVIHERKKMLDQEGDKRRKILVIHGPNLDRLGRREPSVYGTSTLEEIDEEIKKTAEECGMSADTFQSNHEGVLIEKIYEAAYGYDVLIINAAAYTHTSIAIRDALLMLDIPIIEVHLSNIYRREPFRQKSMIADVATAQVVGFGKDGYTMAVRAAAKMSRPEKRTEQSA